MTELTEEEFRHLEDQLTESYWLSKEVQKEQELFTKLIAAAREREGLEAEANKQAALIREQARHTEELEEAIRHERETSQAERERLQSYAEIAQKRADEIAALVAQTEELKRLLSFVQCIACDALFSEYPGGCSLADHVEAYATLAETESE